MTEKLGLEKGMHSETWYEDEDRSVAFVTLRGLGDRVVNNRSKMRYEILAGCGVFAVGDKPLMYVEPGAVVDVPAGTPYHDEGTFMMLVTAEPPFRSEDVVNVEPA